MITATETKLPKIKTALPGPKAKDVIAYDAKYMSPSLTRDYPLVAERASGAIVEDADGNTFLDFAAAIYGRLKLVVGPKSGQSGGTGKELRRRGRGEHAIGILFVDRFSRLRVNDENPPMGLPVIRPASDRLDPGGQRLLGRCDGRENEDKKNCDS